MPSARFVVSRAGLLAAVCALTSPLPLPAIVYGFADTANVFKNTGAFIVKSDSTGSIFPICTGTLISPTVFLTASHCTLYFEQTLRPAGYTAYVSFDAAIPFGPLTSSSTNLVPVVQVVTNPNYNQRQSESGDIAVLIVPDQSGSGIVPALLPSRNLLDDLSARNGLKDAVFTPVGYGLQNRMTGGGKPFFQDLNPVPRMYAFSGYNALSPGYLRLSQNYATGNGGACYGDSGGPNFYNHEGQHLLVAITITGDAVCRATNVVYRLDTDSARQFLAPYVTLP